MRKKSSFLTRISTLVVTAVILLSCFPVSVSAAKTELYIFNCGDYIAETTVEKFEKAYPEYEVIYEVFDTNEAMYQKLVSSNIPYDVLIPSDYMIERLIKEDRLKEIDMSKLENYKYIGEAYKNTRYDPENKYSVPYMWGTLGILYNKERVKETVDSWSILWDEKYSGQILMLDSMRDSMAVALKKLGYDLNTTNKAEIDAAAKALLDQKPLVAEYGVDVLKEKMIQGSYSFTVAYSGDALYMQNQNAELNGGESVLEYVIPKEGSNFWIDAMCIPKTSKNTEGAMKFIDFMCSTEIAYDNVEYIEYSTPHTEALKELGDEYINNNIYNPSAEILANCSPFAYLEPDVQENYNKAWESVRLASDGSYTKWIILGVAVVVVAAVVVIFVIRKKKMNKLKYE
ncbi:MAG: ABC transporter substrate-binding protein [Clostridia bacterium]|nr:ABC transporter substrate-binding protein [Clostridia bacterium]